MNRKGKSARTYSVKKRAPGAGRPRGPYGDSSAFTMRMSDDLREAINRRAAEDFRSASATAEILLRQALGLPVLVLGVRPLIDGQRLEQEI